MSELGRIFSFVTAELNDKCSNIEKCIQKEFTTTNNNNTTTSGGSGPIYYATVKSAIEYEKSNGTYAIHKQTTISLLRLLRGLDFIRRLCDNAYSNMETNKRCHEIALEAYDETLAFRHRWGIRHLARVGFHLLPKKHDMIHYMLRGSPPYAHYKENDHLFQEFISTIHRVFFLVHKTYDENDFLELVFC